MGWFCFGFAIGVVIFVLYCVLRPSGRWPLDDEWDDGELD